MKKIEVTPLSTLDQSNEGVSLFVGGKLEVVGPPEDPDFGFIAEGQFDLNRKVEVLMWEEKVEYHTQRIGDWINQAAKVDY